MYQIKLSNQAEKDLKKIDKRFLAKISASLDTLASNPLLGEKMGGEFRGSYRIKIPPVRIIYTPDIESKKILIRAIKHRQGAYK